MSADLELVPDESQMFQDQIVQQDQIEPRMSVTQEEFTPRTSSDVEKKSPIYASPILNKSPDQPLNAEVATVLVLKFLRRMGMRIITPRKAVLEDDVFVVNVDLKEAAAIIHINSDTREIVEHTIEPHPKEVKPLPIPSRRVIILLGVVFIGVIIFTFQTLLITLDRF